MANEYESKKKWWTDNEGKFALGEALTFGLWPDQPDVNEMAFNQRKAFEGLAEQYRSDAMQGASAIGQMVGQGLNRRGLGDSPLGAGITAQSQTQALQKAMGELNQMRSQMEMGIQDRKWQQEMMEYQTQMQMLQELIGMLGSVGGAYLGGLGTPASTLPALPSSSSPSALAQLNTGYGPNWMQANPTTAR